MIWIPNDFEKKLPSHLMLPVAGGTFLMGSLDDDADKYDDELPQHEVTVSGFLLGQHPVTQALWKAVMNGENPSRFQGDDRPVEQVSWDDIDQKFLPALRRLTGLAYRLPTEAEWEYAARGGSAPPPPAGGEGRGEAYKYAGSDRLKDVGWYAENSDGGTKPVGQKYPNQLGLFDMSGNVWEWCEDWYGGSDYYEHCKQKGIMENPHGPEKGAYRVIRGGSWAGDARNCRVASRHSPAPGDRAGNLGFRLALSLQADGRPVPAFL